jgi:hypothetical protein
MTTLYQLDPTGGSAMDLGQLQGGAQISGKKRKAKTTRYRTEKQNKGKGRAVEGELSDKESSCREEDLFLDEDEDGFEVDKEAGDRNHSLPMTREDMDKVMVWSYSKYPAPAPGAEFCEKDREVATKHLLFCAYTSVGWTLWTR